MTKPPLENNLHGKKKLTHKKKLVDKNNLLLFLRKNIKKHFVPLKHLYMFPSTASDWLENNIEIVRGCFGFLKELQNLLDLKI